MQPSAARRWITAEAGATAASGLAKGKERFDDYGRRGYVLIWALRPAFDLAIAALIYAGGRRDLIPYVVVALTANSVVWTTLFGLGEILDRERLQGTLVPLFLAPCSRLSWLAGFAAAGFAETAVSALIVGVAGTWLFHVRFDPNWPVLLVAVGLFLLAMAGLGLILSAIGLVLKKANKLANLVWPVITLLGGIYYPVAALPAALRLPARALPVGYGMEAIAGAALHHAAFTTLAGALLPLAAFALLLPLTGAATFHALERLVRQRGEIELY